MLALALSASAAEAGMTLTVSAEDGSRAVLVAGSTSRQDDVSVVVVSPDGGIADAYQVTPDPRGAFWLEIKISPTWRQDGEYAVRAHQGSSPLYSAEAGVRVSGGRALQTESVQSTFDRLAEPAERRGVLEVRAVGEFESDMVTVSGTAATLDSPVHVEISEPGGKIILIAQLEPLRDGTFSAPLQTGGPLWETDGTYTVTARQGGGRPQSDSAEIEIAGGVVVPEFGAAAALAAAGFAGAVAAGKRAGYRII